MGPVVLDASAIIAFLIGDPQDPRIDRLVEEAEQIHVPAVCDLEVTSAIRHLVRGRRLDQDEGRDVLIDYVSLPITRHLHTRLLGRVYELRDDFAAADASYIALAEWLDAGLVTADRRMARAVHRHTAVRCLP